MNILEKVFVLLFPPKCVLCRKLLSDRETDLCHNCRHEVSEYNAKNVKLPHLAHWTALWYYEGNVRESIHRFKFSGQRGYASIYARLLAMKVLEEELTFDLLTWVPVSARRRWHRGYDQCRLLAAALGGELSVDVHKTLKKCHHNRPQSTMRDAAQRRANVLGMYRCVDPDLVRGKRILIVDDVLTTGSTVGECARVLLTAGAAQVICATVAAATHQHK